MKIEMKTGFQTVCEREVSDRIYKMDRMLRAGILSIMFIKSILSNKVLNSLRYTPNPHRQFIEVSPTTGQTLLAFC